MLITKRKALPGAAQLLHVLSQPSPSHHHYCPLMSGHTSGHLSILASSLFLNSHVSQKALCHRQLSNGESGHTEP